MTQLSISFPFGIGATILAFIGDFNVICALALIGIGAFAVGLLWFLHDKSNN